MILEEKLFRFHFGNAAQEVIMAKSEKRKGGSRLMECSDCHERSSVHWTELNRAAKPRCFRCGSTRLTLVYEKEWIHRKKNNGKGGSQKAAAGKR